MKNKINILIIASILALLALSGIQAYLINNTYQLKKDAFIDEAKEQVEDIDNSLALDSLYEIWSEDFLNHLVDYKSNRISKKEAVNRISEKANSINKKYKSVYNKKLKKLDLGYEVNYKKVINSIVIVDEDLNDTLFPIDNQSGYVHLFGDKYESDNDNAINQARWYTEHEYFHEENGKIVANSFNLELKTKDFILLNSWKYIIYNRMTTLFVGSIFLFLFVIGLLQYSIKNLITQKNLADVKTDFINNITHELKTPLATLGIATKSLKKEEIKNSKAAFDNTLNIVNRQNDRLQKLIDQVMTNSLSSDDIILNKEQISDNLYFDNLIQDFRLSTQNKSLVIQNEVLEEEVLLRVDKFHFTTAILNILENAVKYGNDSIKITINTSLKNSYYQIRISDNGIGISEKNYNHLFDKFYRISDGDVHNVKGLGLGLYYTSQIIKAHNGTIEVESELNEGSTFIIKIPVQ